MFIKKSNIRYIVPAVSIMFGVSITFAQEQQGYSIIDTAHDTRPYLDKLWLKGVRVIGRFYGRCHQPRVREKRLIDNIGDSEKDSEINKIRSRGFKVLSVYQYLSNSPCKLIGREGKFVNKVQVVKDNLPVCLGLLSRPSENNKASCIVPKQQNTAYDEGRLDAKYAIEQASQTGQPKNSAIYFGMDFDYLVDWKVGNRRVCLNILDYFKGVKYEIDTQSNIDPEKKYKVGAYGNGFTLMLLTGKLSGKSFDKCGKSKDKLIDYTWLSKSLAHMSSREYYKSNEWDIFQEQIQQDFDGKRRFFVDYDVNNKNRQDFGFW